MKKIHTLLQHSEGMNLFHIDRRVRLWNYRNCFCIISTIMAAAIIENNIDPPPSTLREVFINLIPIANSAAVMAISTRDIAIIDIQYKISNKDAVNDWSVSKP